MQTKKCSKCNQHKDISLFSKCSARSDGLQNYCKQCSRERVAVWQNENHDTYLAMLYAWKKKNPADPEKAKQYAAISRKRNKHVKTKLNANRRFRKRNQIIPLSKDHQIQMSLIYDLASKMSKDSGVEYQVDHIIPLAGKNCSGLHVPWNLQIITATENRKKSNKIPNWATGTAFL